MKITILVEGQTERAFKQHLNTFLRERLARNMPKLDFFPIDGRIPKRQELQRVVRRLLNRGRPPSDAVIALTDVYTGTNPPDFETAADAKQKMKQWAGNEKRFHPHVALHDFEAWLLPYWSKIQQRAGSNRTAPGRNPEMVNHGNPPAKRLAEVYRTGKKSRSYSKTIEAGAILQGEDLLVAINACPELKAFVNTILLLCDSSQVIP